MTALSVLELDPNSSLRTMFASAKRYVRTYFRPDEPLGTTRDDGAILEDITRLTLPDNSLDLIVSSDVLEHVPDASAAFRETYRVLKSGGTHVFTIPIEDKTERLAEIRDGRVYQIVQPPEYHSDPLDPKGILAFWHYGPDMQDHFGDSGLQFTRFEASDGPLRSMFIWEARKPN